MALKAAPRGYALWLVPTGDVEERFAEVIRTLSARFRTPRFAPHVTLLSGVPGPEANVRARAAELASRLRPLEVRLLTVHARPDYFQSVVIRVDPTRELMDAQARARIVLGGRQDGPFFPHLSLMYGRTPMEKKESLLRELGDDFRASFTVRSLQLVLLSGAPEDWRAVASLPLAERRRRARAR